VPAYPDCPEKEAVKRMYDVVCYCVMWSVDWHCVVPQTARS